MSNGNGKAKRKEVKEAYGGTVNKFLKQINPYAQTLEDPWAVTGVKIPDNCTYPSASFSIVDKRVAAVNASGMAVVAYGMSSSASAPGTLVPFALTGGLYLAGYMSGSGSVSSDVFNSVGASSLQFSAWNATSASVPSLFSMVRLVSAGVSVTVSGSLNTSQGKMVAAFFPGSQLIREQSGAITLSRLLLQPGCQELNVNTGKAIKLRYRPVDPRVWGYSFPLAVAANTTTDMEYYPGTLVVLVTGATTGVNLEVTFQGNYEGVPVNSSFSPLQISSSPVDPLSLSHGVQHAAEIKPATVAVAPPAIETSSPMKHQSPHPVQAKGTSMFEKIVSAIPDIAEKGKSVLTTLGPLMALL